ncbi:palmitoyltransferase [Anaeramoeba ignava]|uniref:Palmitoyltransferase n=1 Tax=Anaeramoeba ignava TaxID=1746090 RepID=A0A9Q0LJQ4_ANAIG|nr:palmitoyltransferase [Anaeramoeba ignava]
MEFKSIICPICKQKYSKERKPMIICLKSHSICEKYPFAFGSSANIYKAKWGTNQIVIKKLSIQTDEYKKLFQNEVNFNLKLNYPNIIRIFGIVEFDNDFGILMEYAEQGTLSLQIDSLSFQEQIDYSLEIIDGIKYLHLNSIIHRDLKPNHILISNNKPKISGFGNSQIQENTMKVEKFINDFISNFLKEKPFEDEDFMSIPSKILNGERPEFPNDFPKELIEVIKKGWNQNPKERCSLNEFIQCLDQMKPNLQN